MSDFIKEVSVFGLFESGNDYSISFESGSNCLFGDNGTGKTTLINLIVAVLSGDIGALSDLEFDFVEVTTVKNDFEHRLSVYKKPVGIDDLDYGGGTGSLIEEGSSVYSESIMSKLSAEIQRDLELDSMDESDYYEIIYEIENERISFRYPINEGELYFAKRVAGSRKHKVLLHALNALINLTHVPLLRGKNTEWNVLDDEARKYKGWDRKSESSRFDASTAVLRQIESSFIRMAGALTREDNDKLERFKSQIIQKFLVGEDMISSPLALSLKQPRSEYNDVSQLFEQLKSAGLDVPLEKLNENFEALGILHEKANEAFEKSEFTRNSKSSFKKKKAADEEMSESFIRFLVARKLFERFEWILNDVEELQKERNRLWVLFSDYGRLVNKFLNNKSFSIGKDGTFEVISGARKIDLKKLSSGEKHIVALLGRAALSREKGSVFIADEPELSLHLTWQRMMLPSILELSPKSQVIVATHSPAIISRESNKIDLGEL